MQLSPELKKAIARTQLYTDGYDYIFLRFPLAQASAVAHWLEHIEIPFLAAVWDSFECSVVVKRTIWETTPHKLQVASASPFYKCITFNVTLAFNLVGYLASMTQLLAENHIPVMVFSAFSRDHIFVQKSDFNRAWELLQTFIKINTPVNSRKPAIG